MKCMRVLVTGAAGMVGRHLIRCLWKVGYQVIPVDLVKGEGIIFELFTVLKPLAVVF